MLIFKTPKRYRFWDCWANIKTLEDVLISDGYPHHPHTHKPLNKFTSLKCISFPRYLSETQKISYDSSFERSSPHMRKQNADVCNSIYSLQCWIPYPFDRMLAFKIYIIESKVSFQLARTCGRLSLHVTKCFGQINGLKENWFKGIFGYHNEKKVSWNEFAT